MMTQLGWKQCLSDIINICELVPEGPCCCYSSYDYSHSCYSSNFSWSPHMCPALLGQDSHCFKIPIWSYTYCFILRCCFFFGISRPRKCPRSLSLSRPYWPHLLLWRVPNLAAGLPGRWTPWWPFVVTNTRTALPHVSPTNQVSQVSTEFTLNYIFSPV